MFSQKNATAEIDQRSNLCVSFNIIFVISFILEAICKSLILEVFYLLMHFYRNFFQRLESVKSP